MAKDATSQSADGFFPLTNWHILANLKDAAEAQRLTAMGEIYNTYRGPLYALALRSTHSSPDAWDAVHEFFAVCIARENLSLADPDKGRFRDFLKVTFTRFLINRNKTSQTARRLPEGGFLSLDQPSMEEQASFEPRSGESHDDHLERLYRQGAIRTTFKRLGRDLPKLAPFLDSFYYWETGPLLDGYKGPSVRSLAKEANVSEAELRAALTTLSQKFRVLLHAELAADSGSAEMAGNEISFIMGEARL